MAADGDKVDDFPGDESAKSNMVHQIGSEHPSTIVFAAPSGETTRMSSIYLRYNFMHFFEAKAEAHTLSFRLNQ